MKGDGIGAVVERIVEIANAALIDIGQAPVVVSARDDYPTLARQTKPGRCNGNTEEIRGALDRIDAQEAEIVRLRAEVEAANEVLSRARSHAHACGLFTGGHEMPTFAAIVDAWQQLDAEVEALTFDAVTAINRTRCERWHPDFPNDGWSGADWSNAMCGEAGEAANVVKKLRRKDFGLSGAVDPDRDELLVKLADELADTYLYLNLLGEHYGVDLPAAIVRKFNAVSEREGFPERLPVVVRSGPAAPSAETTT